MTAVDAHAPALGVAPVCDALGVALGVARTSYYRWKSPHLGPRRPRPRPRTLSPGERRRVSDALHGERFAHKAPAEVAATLLDEGTHLFAERTMYRVLDAAASARERRDPLCHSAYAKPELSATRPNELWPWDITKLRGPAAWNYFYLYVILDVFSRYVVGCMVAPAEADALAEELIARTYARQGI